VLQKSREMAVQQALSALGQPLLMGHYLESFSKVGVRGAQVLLTHEDLSDHRRSLNLKNMLHILLERGVIPIINENDSVSFEEITVGDNDQLAAMVAVLMEADLLVMLTTPDGLFSQDPGAGQAEIIRCVEADDPLLKISLAGKSAAGRGGMGTKLEAVRKVTPFGIPVILVTARESLPITRALTQSCGTFFKPKQGAIVSARKKKLATLARTQAEVIVDQGAVEAMEQHKFPAAFGESMVSFDGEIVLRFFFKDRLLLWAFPSTAPRSCER
jgi:glutamate 5-kinase